jgi:hypothetical protein
MINVAYRTSNAENRQGTKTHLAGSSKSYRGVFSRNSQHLPKLVPLFPLGSFTPESRCPHHAPIERGSVLCCMICHSSGQDNHPALKCDSSMGIDSKIDCSANYPRLNSIQGTQLESRKQRRHRLFSKGAKLPQA